MYRKVITGVLAIRDIKGAGSHHVYTALCRSLTRYMDMSEGMALTGYEEITSVVDGLPETSIALFTIDDSNESYGFWFTCVCRVVDIVLNDGRYTFRPEDLESLFRHVVSMRYWRTIYQEPQDDVDAFVMEHYLRPYIRLQDPITPHV